MPLKKACIILGAGASSDVHNGSSPIRDGVWRPPLARDLFNIQARAAFSEILGQYPGAQFIASLVAPFVNSGDFSIETELRRYAMHSDPRVSQAFTHVPPYLRDLIHRCSRQYTDVPGSYARLVFEMLAENPHEVLFLVLNYDDLLESALGLLDPTWHFQGIADYVRDEHQAKVVKLHGSTNWFRLFTPHKTLGWNELVYKLDVLQKPPDGEIVVLDRSNKKLDNPKREQHEGQWLYPLVTAPLAGKNVVDAVCPSSHIGVARRFLEDCEKFLIVGTSGLDEDLLDLLKNSIPPPMNVVVQVVSANKETASQTLERFERVVQAFRSRRVTPPGYLYGNGFSKYVTSDEFKAFAKI